MDQWQQILGYILGQQPQPTIYSAEMDNQQFPTIMPENTPYLTPLIRAGQSPGVPREWLIRALKYAQEGGSIKPGDVPQSILGSGFAFPFYESQPNLQNQRWDQFIQALGPISNQLGIR